MFTCFREATTVLLKGARGAAARLLEAVAELVLALRRILSAIFVWIGSQTGEEGKVITWTAWTGQSKPRIECAGKSVTSAECDTISL